jgi:hypothetical protein
MALRKSILVDGKTIIQSSTGASVFAGQQQTQKEFYIKVVEVSGDQKAATARVQFESDGGHQFTRNFGFSTDMNGKNFVAKAYEHLKSLPEFSGAIDC